MPNHVFNRLWAAGSPDDVASLVRDFTSPEEGTDAPLLDFQKVIPMPVELDVTSSSHAKMAFDILGSDTSWQSYANLQWVRFLGTASAPVDSQLPVVLPPAAASKAALIKHFETHLAQWEEAVALAVKYASNLARFGAITWYPWRVRHWGTKWHAWSARYPAQPYVTGASEVDLEFRTAWSAPLPIIQELARRFPTMRLELHSLCEGQNFAKLHSFKPQEGWTSKDFDWADLAREQFERYVRHEDLDHDLDAERTSDVQSV